ncbi:cupin domain-containing protein [Thalassoglobus sp. JC818]|uniref:cupin domain-containing protein n=1 Tax=Thalassoglobus sp. JC818 TaxID=3232136 RepID=UPI003458D60D
MKSIESSYQIVDFSTLPGTPCPCGTARRAFADVEDYPATVHVTEIADDARVHYHKHHTETYYILECGPDAKMQLNDEQVPIRPGMCILIPPGTRHRAIGQMKIINMVMPKFDPADEFFD